MSELTLISQMSCAHFYNQPKWSKEKNSQVFGKCFTQYGHGHDYQIEVFFEYAHPLATEIIKELQEKIRTVKESLDHQHLNFVIPIFKTEIPTTENLAIYFLSELEKQKPSLKIKKLKLFETPELFVEIEN